MTFSPAKSFPNIKDTPGMGSVRQTPTTTAPDTKSDFRCTLCEGTHSMPSSTPCISTWVPIEVVSDKGRIFSANRNCVAPVSHSIRIGTGSAPAVNDT